IFFVKQQLLHLIHPVPVFEARLAKHPAPLQLRCVRRDRLPATGTPRTGVAGRTSEDWEPTTPVAARAEGTDPSSSIAIELPNLRAYRSEAFYTESPIAK